jgi:8-oxo-dGTP diphosphatase
VHRPKYDDWTLPKGKLDRGEKAKDAAVREVLEETGYRCEPVERIASVRYDLADGRPKRVRYWLMKVEDGSFVENDEVDEIGWWPVDKAIEHLSHAHDRTLVADTLASESGARAD